MKQKKFRVNDGEGKATPETTTQSHTCRRTFATLLFRAGVPLMSIAKMTGHGSERALLAYIKATIEENAVMVSKNRFFGE